MNEAELLFTEILDCDRLSLYRNKNLPLDKDKSFLIASALKRRMKAEPIQYILGKADFMGFEFRVNKDVLIPRPETEILVEATIKLARSQKPEATSILDVGTGSGCIAVSLARLIKNCNLTAVDISAKAINIARRNASLNAVAGKINFITDDFFNLRPAACGLQPDSFDVIISNPPYIPTEEIGNLQAEVRHEPRIALDGGIDGLDFYRRIAVEAAGYLKKEGFLAIEIGFGQREEIENIFHKSGNFEIIEVIKDYNKIDRIMIGKLNADKYG